MSMPLNPIGPQNHGNIRRTQNQDRLNKRLFEVLMQTPSESATEALITLLERGVNVNAMGNRGWTPLYLAVYTNDSEAVELLINNGADVNIINDNGRTPLHLAALMGYGGITKFLLDKGAKTNIKDRDGMTPLDWAELHKNEESKYWIRKYVNGEEQSRLIVSSSLDSIRRKVLEVDDDS